MGKHRTPELLDLAHIFYNDAMKSTDSTKGKDQGRFGHTKGAMGFDEESGFWLMSSVPRFPASVADGYKYPSSQLTHGQLMMCVTFNANVFDTIGEQLLYTNPRVHDYHIPEGRPK